jgi:hypothetical protein
MLSGSAMADQHGTLKRSSEVRRDIQVTEDTIKDVEDQIQLEKAKMRQSETDLLAYRAEWLEQM